jgi:uncharacterized repeat protein (TIGR03803 family)
MKTKNLFLFTALIAALNLLPVGQASAQTFATLHHFSGGGGASSFAGLVLSSNTLYGTMVTTPDDFGLVSGMVFALSTQGTGFTNLHNLAGGPYAGLILSGNTLYGTTMEGTQPFIGSCTVFAGHTDGTGLTNLHIFTQVSRYGGPQINPDGHQPRAGVILSGDTLYGTAYRGGSSGSGTVFAVRTNGTGFIVLHNFSGSSSDGGNPQAGLILSGNTLYGTTAYGGSPGNGTVFAVRTNGTGFTILHHFTVTHTNSSGIHTNSDGTSPQAGLILSGNTLYGTASGGGRGGAGAVFAVKTDGTGFTNLHSFTATSGPPPYGNSDGANPQAALVLSGGTLYGTALYGGGSGLGAVFAVRTDGTGFTNLHSFTAITGSYPSTNSDGAYPMGELILLGNTLYGTTAYGGSLGEGTVFGLSFPLPQLTIVRSGASVILSWPTNIAGFDSTGYTLQSTTNLPLPNSWFSVAQSPATNAGQVCVTLPGDVGSKFFRLKSQ